MPHNADADSAVHQGVKRISEEKLRDDFERVVDELGHVPSSTEYTTHGEYSASTLASRFGGGESESYRDAVEDLGYTYSHGSELEPIPKDDIRTDIERVIAELGHVPTHAEYKSHGTYSSTIIADKSEEPGSNSYYDGLDALGFEPPQSPTTAVSDDEVREDFERVVEELGRAPSGVEYRTHGTYSIYTFARRFGPDDSKSFVKAVESLGYDYDPPDRRTTESPSPDEIRADFKRVVAELGHLPERQEYKEHGKYSVEAFIAQFGGPNDHSYYHAVDNLKDTVPVQKTLRPSKKLPDADEYADLPLWIQVFIDTYVVQYLDSVPAEIEKEIGFPIGLGERIVDNYDGIIRRRREAYETGNLHEVALNAATQETIVDDASRSRSE